jgi:hypothetical protein
MSNHPANGNGYAAEVSALDIALDIRLGEIRAAQDGGDVTTREAADMRISALQDHLDAVRALRREHFGDPE